jgi:hypothetical protein
MSKREKKLPVSTSGDKLHAAVKVGLSAIPTLGGAAAEIFLQVIVPPLTKRRDAWFQEISYGLAELERKIEGFSVESLVRNDEFITLLMQASQVAVRNHRKEKLEALRNAVLNAAIKTPDEHLQTILLSFLDTATPWHLRILSFYRDPEIHLKQCGITLTTGDFLSHYVARVFTELEGNDAFRLQIERDLLHYGLILPENAWYSQRTTDTGDKLLALVESPIE